MPGSNSVEEPLIVYYLAQVKTPKCFSFAKDLQHQLLRKGMHMISKHRWEKWTHFKIEPSSAMVVQLQIAQLHISLILILQ